MIPYVKMFLLVSPITDCAMWVITHVHKSAMCVLASKRVILCVHTYVHSHAQYMYTSCRYVGSVHMHIYNMWLDLQVSLSMGVN